MFFVPAQRRVDPKRLYENKVPITQNETWDKHGYIYTAIELCSIDFIGCRPLMQDAVVSVKQNVALRFDGREIRCYLSSFFSLNGSLEFRTQVPRFHVAQMFSHLARHDPEGRVIHARVCYNTVCNSAGTHIASCRRRNRRGSFGQSAMKEGLVLHEQLRQLRPQVLLVRTCSGH